MPLPLRSPFVPATRRAGREVLDDAACDEGLRKRSLTDVARANRLLGGTRAVLEEVRRLLPALERSAGTATMLDVGTGLGDIPAAVDRLARRHGVRLRTIGLDGAPSLARASRRRVQDALAADALALPLASGSVDLVICSQVLHHFDAADAVRVLAELHRVSRGHVVVSDLRRSWLAASGLWVVSFPMRFHPVSRADGMLSVLKGFAASELDALVRAACGRAPTVRHHLGWRLTATWAAA